MSGERTNAGSAYDRAIGCYLGAAIGDAMGGPVETQHAARIKKYYGEITGFLPYQKPPGLADLHPGYALHADPGSITDDTYIRADFTRFFLDTPVPWSVERLGSWLLENAEFDNWWPPAVQALKRVQAGEVTARDGGMTHMQGGGAGWWTPVGVIFRGRPAEAAEVTRSLCRIWKAPLEQDLLSGVQAGVAAAFSDGATVDTVVEALLEQCGPLATTIVERGLGAAERAKSRDDLIREIYNNCLLDQAPIEADAPAPPPEVPSEYEEGRYISSLLSEQIAIAVASFVYSKGDPRASILNTVMVGRDCDSTATTVGSWVGALHGEKAFPDGWVQTVEKVNAVDFDLRALVEQLLELEVSQNYLA